MVEFALPRNSKVKKGKNLGRAQAAPTARSPSAPRIQSLHRYDPDSGDNPSVDIYTVDLDSCGPMVLDR